MLEAVPRHGNLRELMCVVTANQTTTTDLRACGRRAGLAGCCGRRPCSRRRGEAGDVNALRTAGLGWCACTRQDEYSKHSYAIRAQSGETHPLGRIGICQTEVCPSVHSFCEEKHKDQTCLQVRAFDALAAAAHVSAAGVAQGVMATVQQATDSSSLTCRCLLGFRCSGNAALQQARQHCWGA